MESGKYHFETLQLHVGQEKADIATDSRAVPIYQTVSYVFHNCDDAAERFSLKSDGNIYGRLTNSTQDVFEKRMAALEGGTAALATSSGAAAIAYTFQALAKAGDNIVSSRYIYGGTYNYLKHTFPEHGVSCTFVDSDNPENFEKAIRPETKLIFVESMGNPNSNLVDLKRTAEIAHEHKIPLVVDNTFATPYLLRPIEYGADIVVHSATKFIGGHGTTLGGVIVDSGKFDWSDSGKFPQISEPNESYHGISFVSAANEAAFAAYVRAIILRDTGSAISPFNAFMLLQGLETLSLRVERHVENSKKVIEYLQKNPKVVKVNHPSVEEKYKKLYDEYFPNGAGSIFTFELDGDVNDTKKFIDSLQLFSILANVADVKSLVIHPKSTTHAQLSEEELNYQKIYDNTVRFSIGTEHIDDIINDIENAFSKI